MYTCYFFFFNDTATTEIYTLSLHDALPIFEDQGQVALRYAPGSNFNGSSRDIAGVCNHAGNVMGLMPHPEHAVDRKSTRLNSSHANISYAVFCLKKKKNKN